MYNYYRDADVCFAYLVDVPWDDEPNTHNSRFQRSRWFTRGWTLQELIAPKYVEFYDLEWALIGTKHELASLCSHITMIDEAILLDPSRAHDYSIAQKLSWLSLRMTTRKEDIAYCMMGIFKVNMPLLYGEGDRAFIRLQEEIIKRTTDQTFLCWSYPPEVEDIGSDGPFCKSPLGFYKCQNFAQQVVGSHHAPAFAVTNKGLEIQQRCIAYTGRHKLKGFPATADQLLILPQVRDTKHPDITTGVLLQRLQANSNIYYRMRSSVERLDLRNANIRTGLQDICIARAGPQTHTSSQQTQKSPCKLNWTKLYCSTPNIGVKSVLYCMWGLQPDLYVTLPAIQGIGLTLEDGYSLAILLNVADSGRLITLGITEKTSFWLHTDDFPITPGTSIHTDYPKIYEIMNSRRKPIDIDASWILTSDVTHHPLTDGHILTAYLRRNGSNADNEPGWDLELYVGTTQCLVATAKRTYNLLYDGHEQVERPDEVMRTLLEPPSYSSLFQTPGSTEGFLRRSAMPENLFEE